MNAHDDLFDYSPILTEKHDFDRKNTFLTEKLRFGLEKTRIWLVAPGF